MRANPICVVLIGVSRSFQWTMRILGFFTLGLLIITNLVRGSCLVSVLEFCNLIFDVILDDSEETARDAKPRSVDQH